MIRESLLYPIINNELLNHQCKNGFGHCSLKLAYFPFSMKRLHFDKDGKYHSISSPGFTHFIFTLNRNICLGCQSCHLDVGSNYFKTFIRQLRTQEWLGAGCHTWDVSPGKCSNFYDIYHVNSISNHCHQCETECLSTVINYH